MDPDQALIDARAAVALLNAEPADLDHGYTDYEQAARNGAADTLAELFDGLDRWLSSGGFLPDPWCHGGRQQ
jgi:hypothetical protein